MTDQPDGDDDGAARIAGIRISNPGRAVFAGISKVEIARYYQQIAPAMLQELADRPLSLLRLPEGMAGARFFQKHPGTGFPAALKTVAITQADGARADYTYASNAAGLVGAAQMGTVEFHIWGAHRQSLERPDRLVFDLDPDPRLDFAVVTRAALDLRALLADLGLESWAMVSGGKGLHVVVPLRRGPDWAEARQFCHDLAQLCVRRAPDRMLAQMAKTRRPGHIFVDWFRNDRGQTSVAPFSLRARPGAPVALPVTWTELPGLDRANGFDMAAALHRGWPMRRPAPQRLTRAVRQGLDAMLNS